MAKNKARKKKNQKKAQAAKRRRMATTRPVTVDEKVRRVRASAYADESLEDQAVFDDRARSGLPTDIAAQVDQVRTALEHLHAGRDTAAENSVKDIPRRSPMSDWRLFIRGLTDWYAGDHEAATKAFSRLDANRRPARIAETLLYSDRLKADAATDAKSSPGENSSPVSTTDHPAELDQAIFSGAALVHRIRNLRPALAEAQREALKNERIPDAEGLDLPAGFPGPNKLRWIAEFSFANIRHEPELTSAVISNLLRFLTHSPLAPLLESIVSRMPGPPYDPQHFLRRTLYYGNFQDAESEVESFRKKYIDSLPKIESISKPVAAALTAELHLNAARDAQEAGGMSGLSFFGFGRGPDEREIKKHFIAATKACPSYADAHQEYIDWIESELEERRIDKKRQKTLESDLTIAMAHWSAGCPDEIDPRLWLVDHYLEAEKLEAAEPHVRWLADSRNVDLRVRATQWKWHVLEAMRLCRRKAWLSGAKEQLDSAEKTWPAWLSKDWLPYLHAALALRSGDRDAYESIRKQIRASWKPADSQYHQLTDAAMMLAAAQRMRVPAPELKPLRQPIDDAVKNLHDLPHTSLLRAGRFFVELYRAGLLYPAFRMHGGKFAEELVLRLDDDELSEEIDTKDADFWPAMFWLAHQRAFAKDGEVWVSQLLDDLNSPEKVAAIIVHTSVTDRRKWINRECRDALPVLEAAIAKEKDVYLKYWYTTILQKAKEREDSFARSPFGGGGFGGSMMDRLRAMMNEDEDEYDEDDDDDDDDAFLGSDDYDPQCDCLECTETRERLGIPHPWD